MERVKLPPLGAASPASPRAEQRLAALDRVGAEVSIEYLLLDVAGLSLVWPPTLSSIVLLLPWPAGNAKVIDPCVHEPVTTGAPLNRSEPVVKKLVPVIVIVAPPCVALFCGVALAIVGAP